MRRFLLGLLIVFGAIIGILLLLILSRKQNYYQSVADYTQFSSAAEAQAYLNQKLEVGKSTEAEVTAFIIQSGIASKITPNGPLSDSNCYSGIGEHQYFGFLCQVRAPAVDYSSNLMMNLFFLDYYLIDFVFDNNKLKSIEVYSFVDRGFDL